MLYSNIDLITKSETLPFGNVNYQDLSGIRIYADEPLKIKNHTPIKGELVSKNRGAYKYLPNETGDIYVVVSSFRGKPSIRSGEVLIGTNVKELWAETDDDENYCWDIKVLKCPNKPTEVARIEYVDEDSPYFIVITKNNIIMELNQHEYEIYCDTEM